MLVRNRRRLFALMSVSTLFDGAVIAINDVAMNPITSLAMQIDPFRYHGSAAPGRCGKNHAKSNRTAASKDLILRPDF